MSNFVPVLHSVSYSGAWQGQSRLPLDAFLLKAVELGYRHVALVAKQPHLSPLDYGQDARKALKARLADLGLTLAALMGYTDFTAGLDHPGIPSAEMNAAYVGTLAKLAHDLDTPRVRIFTGYQRQGIAYDAQYLELVKGLRLSARESARYGVTLVLQNHHDLACHHDQLIWLLQEVNEPNLRLAFDAWAPFLQGVTGDALVDAVKRVGPWLEFTTVADYQVQPRFRYDAERVNYVAEHPPVVRAVAPGAGQVDYAAFFRGLHEIGYRGPVAYEMCAMLQGGGSIENLDRTARAFLEFLKGQGRAASAAHES